MYLEHFGLKEPPFSLTPDTHFWYEYASHHDALNVLTMALRSGEGFIKVTGEVGLGKTLICRKLLNGLGDDFVTAYIPNPHLSPASMRFALAEELGLDPSGTSTQEQLLRLIAQRLLVLARAEMRGETPRLEQIMLGFGLALGIGVFLFAMWWDSSDPRRETRRSDVAFWLHLLAAPLIVHPIFALLGLTDGTASAPEAIVVLLVYVALGLTALAIDRRALLVSALAYVLYALNSLFEQYGAVELSVALTALVIGSALLLLSAFWHSARRTVVQPLPSNLKAKLPVVDRAIAAA